MSSMGSIEYENCAIQIEIIRTLQRIIGGATIDNTFQYYLYHLHLDLLYYLDLLGTLSAGHKVQSRKNLALNILQP